MNLREHRPVHIVGGGLAGCEAAWQVANGGIPVVLHEMRPVRMTPAHVTGQLCELVCSNSFRSDDAGTSAIGLLHEEMRRSGSLIIRTADAHRVPAGGALAVDRSGFSAAVENAILSHALIQIRREEIAGLPPSDWQTVILATGPLTGATLAEALRSLTSADSLAFFDALAPIVHRDSIDFTKAWYQSRYNKGGGSDYINCPLTRSEYDAFIGALLSAEKTPFKEWECDIPYFEACLPIEVMAQRGRETLAHGPMKPVGLSSPHDGGRRPFAVVQLRQDNALATLYNMVGFQTKLKHGEQVRIFRTIPALEHAEFARLGGLHRNTFVNSPMVLNDTLGLRADPRIRLAGQITGCEGYVESAAIGLLAGRFVVPERDGAEPRLPPPTTAFGALLRHLTADARPETFQPMNINFGLFPPLPNDLPDGPVKKGADRRRAITTRALADLATWLANDRLPRSPALT